MSDIDAARAFVAKALIGVKSITSVTALGNVVRVSADFATVTSYARSRIEQLEVFVHRHWRDIGFAFIPSGTTTVLGLPDATSPHLVPGPPPGGTGTF